MVDASSHVQCDHPIDPGLFTVDSTRNHPQLGDPFGVCSGLLKIEAKENQFRMAPPFPASRCPPMCRRPPVAMRNRAADKLTRRVHVCFLSQGKGPMGNTPYDAHVHFMCGVCVCVCGVCGVVWCGAVRCGAVRCGVVCVCVCCVVWCGVV